MLPAGSSQMIVSLRTPCPSKTFPCSRMSSAPKMKKPSAEDDLRLDPDAFDLNSIVSERIARSIATDGRVI